MPALRIADACPQSSLPPPFHAWALPDGAVWTEFHRANDGYLLRFPEFADFEVSADGQDVTCVPAPDIPEGALRHLYLNQVLPLALSRQGKLVFHASAVDIGHAAIAFAGDSGRGKSTLAAAFAIAGHGFLTDDGLVLEQGQQDCLVLPSHPSIRLWEDSEAALIRFGTRSATRAHYTSKARFLAGEDLLFCREPRPLRCAYFLGDGSARGIEFRRLTGAEALMEWVRLSFLLDVEEKPGLASHFEGLARLVRQTVHFRLDYPRRYDVLNDVRDAVLGHVRELDAAA